MHLGTIPLELGPWIRSSLMLVHFVGIILGVGAATLLDLIILRFMLTQKITYTATRIVLFSSGVIIAGLILLWISGLGFFVYYWNYDLSKIENPKLAAKIIIVGVLTLNSFMVHSFVLPKIKTQVGYLLFERLSMSHCLLLLLIGIISVTSWYVPLILGIVPQFNNSISFEVILVSYASLIVFVNIIAAIAMIIMRSGIS